MCHVLATYRAKTRMTQEVDRAPIMEAVLSKVAYVHVQTWKNTGFLPSFELL